MRITLEEDPRLTETEVVIRCREATPQVAGLLAALRSFDQRLTGEREGRTYLLEAGQVLYIESVDKRTFLYTGDSVYETKKLHLPQQQNQENWKHPKRSK